MMPYNPRNWFWIIGGNESKAWSSASGGYVAQWESDRATRIANEIELYDVLAKEGLASRAPSRTFTAEEVRAALLRIDAAATGSASNSEDLASVADTIGFQLPPISS